MENERRYKVVYVGAEAMITAMASLTDDTARWVNLPVFKGLPEGFSVQDVHYEYSRMAFAVVVSHESFPIVPQWEVLMAIGAEMEMQTFDMDKIRRWAKANPKGKRRPQGVMQKLSASAEEFCVGKIGKKKQQ